MDFNLQVAHLSREIIWPVPVWLNEVTKARFSVQVAHLAISWKLILLSIQ